MSNGICEIIVGGEKHALYFNRQAVEEVAMRTEANISGNGFKVLCDLVYAGICAGRARQDLPYPAWHEVYALVEQLYEQEDGTEQQATIHHCFNTSKYGAQYLEKLEEIKKKAEAMMAPAPAVKKPRKSVIGKT